MDLFLQPGPKGHDLALGRQEVPRRPPKPKEAWSQDPFLHGRPIFFDSLHAFPQGIPFSVKLANVYIQGGERTKVGHTSQRQKRPKMTEEALKKLLARHGKEIIDEAEDKNGERANQKTS